MVTRVSEHLEGRVIVAKGDITEFDGDAIVNAANSSLMGGGGVDGAIHRAAGPALRKACEDLRATRYPDGLPTGEAVATPAGDLPVAHVIHTVGPVWNGGDSSEEDLLKSAYHKSIAEAREVGAERIAFPAISTGVYGFPKDRAARVAFSALSVEATSGASPAEMWLVFFSESDATAFEQSITM